ncbi:F-box/kelch-repeat protein At1g80440-like [Lycium barbarum]|uniref:F-box/kelch-repeat protein At1g80440-like n=1 Tax=Lycium barbarum TaxID=112863 RepID=UPI00293E489D|nr:F-box/kelch-repeat protein At1g80440-like [Lycium barbarum]
MEIIPNLPYDMGLECLIRIPYNNFSSVTSVCQNWKLQIALPEFWRQRKAIGLTRQVILMAQARLDPKIKLGSSLKYSAFPLYGLTLYEPDSGYWAELPFPGTSDGLPMFCQLIGVGLNLVVMGGWNPITWEPSKDVFVYNFVSATWRRGAEMPGCRRSFFGSGSDSERTVYIAGGHDEEKNALKSAMAYDVSRDEWLQMPDMASERDECKCTFYEGKFHVIGGYETCMQGRFGTSAESFDVSTWQWDQVNEHFFESATCPRTCVEGGDGKLYLCRDGDVLALGKSTWQVVTALPLELKNIAFVTAWRGKILMTGSMGFNEPYNTYVLDLESYKWTKMDTPVNFSGHVQSGCCLEM